MKRLTSMESSVPSQLKFSEVLTALNFLTVRRRGSFLFQDKNEEPPRLKQSPSAACLPISRQGLRTEKKL